MSEEEPLNNVDKDDADMPAGGSAVLMPTTGVAMGVLVQGPPPVVVPTIHPRPLSMSSHANQTKADKSADEEDDEAETATQKRSNRRTMEVLEMEQFREPLQMSGSEDEYDDQAGLNRSVDSDDMEGLQLLPDVVPPPKRTRRNNAGLIRDPVCWSSQKIGNTTVFWPAMYHKSGFGMIGPHFLGPPCVLAVLWSASWFFIQSAWTNVGWMTAAACVGFTIVATYHLGNCCLRDPGIVRPIDDGMALGGQVLARPPPPDRHHRWCDLCQAYQPPTGAHCPECNVCVAGYDHHCAWMGCCIGQRNYQSFLRFNMTWLVYLSYAIFWVSLLGPIFFGPDKQQLSDPAANILEDPDIFVFDEDMGGGDLRTRDILFFLRQ